MIVRVRHESLKADFSSSVESALSLPSRATDVPTVFRDFGVYWSPLLGWHDPNSVMPSRLTRADAPHSGGDSCTPADHNRWYRST